MGWLHLFVSTTCSLPTATPHSKVVGSPWFILVHTIKNRKMNVISPADLRDVVGMTFANLLEASLKAVQAQALGSPTKASNPCSDFNKMLGLCTTD